jgi:hypothetical protein
LRLAQGSFSGNWKFADIADRPKGVRRIFARASFVLVPALTGQNRRAIWNKSAKVERVDD